MENNKLIEMNERIAYLPASDNPLSADVFFIKDKDRTYIFDVGECDAAAELINDTEHLTRCGLMKAGGKKTVVISHFHRDHMGNIGRIDCDEIIVSGQSHKNVPEDKKDMAILVDKESVNRGDIIIYPLPSTHAKGCLCLVVDDYIFLGDGIYAGQVKGQYCMNVQFLKAQIDLLESISATKCVLSHDKPVVKDKAVVLRLLRARYGQREKNAAYIILN